MPPKAFMSWSSGKDSAFAFYEARRLGLADIVGVLTTVNEVYDRVAMHGVRSALLDRQIAALGLPCIKVPLPSPCPNEIYEARMAEAVKQIKAQGVRHMIFGDLYLEDIRAYREEKLAAAGMEGIFPLWGRNTGILAEEMIESGLVANIVCLDPKRIDRRFAGRRFDRALLAETSAGHRSLRRERRIPHGCFGGPDVRCANLRNHRRNGGAGRFCVYRCDLLIVQAGNGSVRLTIAGKPARLNRCASQGAIAFNFARL